MNCKKFTVVSNRWKLINYNFQNKRYVTLTSKFINYINWLVDTGVDVTIYDPQEELT